jgi:hypothetical protein
MDAINVNTNKNSSSFRFYALIVIFLILIIASVSPFINNFRENNGYVGEQNLAKEYGFTPTPYSQYYLEKYITPALEAALPFVFILLVLCVKEKKKDYKLTKLRQETIVFRLLVITVLLFLFYFIFIGGMYCESWGCLGSFPIIETAILCFLFLIFTFSLWFLGVRYQWKKYKFLAVVICLALLLLLGYLHIPLF